jgi:hypothetical protein
MQLLDRYGTWRVLRRVAAPAAAVLLSVAGAVHFAVAAQHVGEWWVYGAFFVLLGSAQCGAGLVFAAGHGRRFADATGWANLAVVLLWTATRTTGLPIGPHPWVPEPVTWLDVTVTVVELATALACFAVHTARSDDPAVLPHQYPTGPPCRPDNEEDRRCAPA